MPKQEQWDNLFLKMAFDVSTLSKDSCTKVGAILVTPDNKQISFGYNGMVTGIEETTEMWNNRDVKLKHVIHAEENCLLNSHFSPKGCSMYITHQPCPKCIIRLCQVGIKKVLYINKYEKMGDIDIWNVYAKLFDLIKQQNLLQDKETI